MHRQLSPKIFPMFNCIRASHDKAQQFAYYLEYLTFHLPDGRLEPALRWLIRNDLIGQKFLDFVYHNCQQSPLELFRFLTMKIEKEKGPRKIHIKDIA